LIKSPWQKTSWGRVSFYRELFDYGTAEAVEARASWNVDKDEDRTVLFDEANGFEAVFPCAITLTCWRF